MQYIGIARTDQKGIIQVGVRPEILEEMLAQQKQASLPLEAPRQQKKPTISLQILSVLLKMEKITDMAVDDFIHVVDEIENANKSVNTIADMVRNNAEIVQTAVQSLEQISGVVKRNVHVSQESEQTAQKLANESEGLQEMID